jgi:hypothetical protein
MRPGLLFDDVLDARLREASPVTHEVRPVRTGTAAAYGFFFAPASAPSHVAQRPGPAAACSRIPGNRHVGAVAAPAADRRAAERPVMTDATARPRRRLGRPQQKAIAELVALGAELREDFSAAELRSAFRVLARRYHPDRHTQSSETERATLALQFARVHDAYRLLAES